MAIYAISDLHLSFSTDKPMNVFGDEWTNYEQKLAENWKSKIHDNDLILLPGDFSWATYIEDTIKDFEYLNSLPGRKIISKGNHDYWWTTVTKMNKFLNDNNFKTIEFLFNSAIEYENKIIVGAKGYTYNNSAENSEKMLNRESIRLENSIKEGIKKENNNKTILCENIKESYNLKKEDKYFSEQESKEIICMMHYPPITKSMIENRRQSIFIQLMKKYKVKTCIYGHLHSKAQSEAIEGIYDGINLKLVSSDYLKFNPYKIL